MHRGTVEFYNKTRKFGFIINDNAELNQSHLFESDVEWQAGDVVDFELTVAGEKGQKVKNMTKVEQ
jgi:cold shock CspA family protein